MRTPFRLVCSTLSLGAVLFAGGFALTSRTAAHPDTVDPRLVLHPRTVSVKAIAPEAGTVRLRVYPAIPGPQHVAVFLSQHPHPSAVTLTADMPGMPMRPTTATVARRGALYRGTLNLPMFGVYRVRIRMAHRQPITLRVVLPISIGR
jgi:hypothetical protein